MMMRETTFEYNTRHLNIRYNIKIKFTYQSVFTPKKFAIKVIFKKILISFVIYIVIKYFFYFFFALEKCYISV